MVRLGVVCWALAALASCKRATPPPPVASSAPSADLAPVVTARRPARRYYLTHTSERCEISFVDPTRVSELTAVPCPADLRVGEHIRIAGKTCVRESDEASRVEPVVCPDPLTNLEKRERGELPGQRRPEDGGDDAGP